MQECLKIPNVLKKGQKEKEIKRGEILSWFVREVQCHRRLQKQRCSSLPSYAVLL